MHTLMHNMPTKVVVITDKFGCVSCQSCRISQDKVDYVVEIAEIGDPNGISFGPTK